MAEDMTSKLAAIKEKLAETDRQRTAAETRTAEAKKRLKEIDDQIAALGVKPDECEATVAKLEEGLAKELASVDAALNTELAAYKALGV